MQQIPISAESSLPVHSHSEQAIAISHLMDLDDSHGFFDLAIIKEKMTEVSQAIAMEPPLVQKSVETQPDTTKVSDLLAVAEPIVG